ncbi:MAG: 23S rRNA (pseudouridine(1915)-N(3))-methyltransferase RlmH [Clostridiales bacterium]|nr:23S rRNA (pseudouridine(1915)-N(3))-methyltransferase RlmH [Clostridiales bacterium]
MKIQIIAVGKLKEKYLKEGIAEYSKRLSRFCELQIIEVDDEQAPDSLSPMQEVQVKRKEAERILKKIKDNAYVIVLDVKGEKCTSEAFSAKLQGLGVSGVSNIAVIIGGSLGHDSAVLEKASYRMSISDMTFPHQLIRLVLLEQLYRAFKIANNETYHK